MSNEKWASNDKDRLLVENFKKFMEETIDWGASTAGLRGELNDRITKTWESIAPEFEKQKFRIGTYMKEIFKKLDNELYEPDWGKWAEDIKNKIINKFQREDLENYYKMEFPHDWEQFQRETGLLLPKEKKSEKLPDWMTALPDNDDYNE